ncbi:MAG: hypothetical protein MUO99_01330 [Dehalococcoidales bacterium]|nr:hypothetical protein [Dehalococcoidales bacterium]
METEQERVRQDFTQELSEVMSLAKRIEAVIGRTVQVNQHTTPHSWGFKAPKNFAFPLWQKQKNRLWIQAEKRWADGAGVSGSADHTDDKGVFGRPAVYWEVRKGDAERRNRVAAMLARVCEARHR